MDAIVCLGRAHRATSRISNTSRWGASALALTVLLAIALPTPLASAKPPPPPYTVAPSPEFATAGSTGNTVTFQFTATDASNDPVTVVVPAAPGGAPWTPPQSSNPGGAGYVAASRQSCKSASVASVTGAADGPWTVTVNAKCSKGKTFALTYSGVTAATKAALYTFTTGARIGGATIPVVSQPTVTVAPGVAANLTLSGLENAVAGTEQSATVTARDAYGNVAGGYRGTVRLSADGWGFPDGNEHTFTAGDGAAHTFQVTPPVRAGEQSLTATDTATSTLTASQTITISPGPTTAITSAGVGLPALLVGQTARIDVTFLAVDAYDNLTPDWNHPVHVLIEDGVTPVDQDLPLENGRGTIGVEVTMGSSGMALRVTQTSDPSFGLTDLGNSLSVRFAVPLDATKVQIASPTATPGGLIYMTFDATIDKPIFVEPSIGFRFGEATKNLDGTYTVPFQTVTPGGAVLVGKAIVSTPVDTTSGLVVANLADVVAASGQNIEVMGCTDLLFRTFATGTGEGLPPAPPCPEKLAPVATIPPNTPWIVFRQGAQSQAAALVSVLGLSCFDSTKFYDFSTDKCVE
jgi:hypothetical protein